MKELIVFPVLALVVMLQSAVVSRVPLLWGYADLMLVVLVAWALQPRINTAWHWAVIGGFLMGFISGVPWFVPLFGYLLVVAAAQLLRRRIWQAPLLSVFAVTFFGTLVIHVLSLVVLNLLGHPLPVADSLGLITLPSLLLNLLISIPVYSVIRDLANWMVPAEDEE
jgi:rod shape-determining protein MreD